jgi:hypothetical protein
MAIRILERDTPVVAVDRAEFANHLRALRGDRLPARRDVLDPKDEFTIGVVRCYVSENAVTDKQVVK